MRPSAVREHGAMVSNCKVLAHDRQVELDLLRLHRRHLGINRFIVDAFILGDHLRAEQQHDGADFHAQ